MCSSKRTNDGQRDFAYTICTRCGCTCDDIRVLLKAGQPIAAENACQCGEDWLLAADQQSPECMVEGAPVSVEEGAKRAARLLLDAYNPLVFGLAQNTSDAQRRAVAIADRLGATFDTETSMVQGSKIVASQRSGEVTCTYGEVRHRADLVLFWGVDVLKEAPRFFSKYIEAAGDFVGAGRAGKTVVVIDPNRTETSKQADFHLPISAGHDFEALWTLRALAQGVMLDAEHVLTSTGLPLTAWQDLMQRMKRATYGVICYGRHLMHSPGVHANCEALSSLTREMNRHARFVASSIGGAGNLTGADAVSAWQTGYPFAVNFARGFPRYGPGEFTAAAMLARREVDAALVVGSDPLTALGFPACEHLRRIPFIAIDGRKTETTDEATVWFRSAAMNLSSSGTVYRSDGVPLPLRAVVESRYLSGAEILAAIERKILQNLNSTSGG